MLSGCVALCVCLSLARFCLCLRFVFEVCVCRVFVMLFVCASCCVYVRVFDCLFVCV